MAIESISSMGASSATITSSRQVAVPEAKEASVQAQAVNSTAVITNVAQQQGTESSANENGSQRQPSERTIKQAISEINRKINHNTVAEFGYHDKTNRVTIKIVDKETKEVIREVPPEKTLEMIAKVWELAGILVDEKK